MIGFVLEEGSFSISVESAVLKSKRKAGRPVWKIQSGGGREEG